LGLDRSGINAGATKAAPHDQFLPSKSVKKGEYSPVECTVYTDFDFQNA
jgi:hypothetical protein